MPSTVSLFANWETEIDGQLAAPKFNTLTQGDRDKLVLAVKNIARGEAIRHAKSIDRPQEIDDFEGTALVAIVEASRTYQADRGTQFTTWATAYIRRCLKRETASLERAQPYEFIAEVPAKSDEDTELEIEHRTPNAEQLLLLSKLPASNREIVRLTVFERMSPEQVADYTGQSVKDVKLAIRNAGQTLGNFITADESPANLFGDIYPEESAAKA